MFSIESIFLQTTGGGGFETLTLFEDLLYAEN
jgi:hypothetical protein